MKKNIYLIAAAALMTACAGSQKGYTISGTVEGATDGDSIFLSVIEGRQLVHLDSAAIVNGQFTFKGVQDSTINAVLNCETAEGKSLSLRFYLENGAIKVNLSDFDDVVTGTPNNDLYQTYRAEVSQLQKELNQMMEQLNDSTLTEEQQQVLESKAKETMEKLDACPLEAMRKNITNRVGIDLLKNNYYALSLEELEELLPQVPAEYNTDERIVRIKELAEKMKLTSVGQKFTDFAMLTPEGKEIKLSDYVGKGKVVLVDFWASWCGPCRREMPNLVEAYKQYKGKKFEIVGVSLDRDAESWQKAIEKLGITWPQMSDLKYWACEGAQLYAVSSIPHTLLIDGEGTIIARGLHGEELQSKLAEVLK